MPFPQTSMAGTATLSMKNEVAHVTSFLSALTEGIKRGWISPRAIFSLVLLLLLILMTAMASAQASPSRNGFIKPQCTWGTDSIASSKGLPISFSVSTGRHAVRWFDIISNARGRGSTASPDSVAVFTESIGPNGHVVWVDSLLSDGSGFTARHSNMPVGSLIQSDTFYFRNGSQLQVSTKRSGGSVYWLRGYVYMRSARVIMRENSSPRVVRNLLGDIYVFVLDQAGGTWLYKQFSGKSSFEAPILVPSTLSLDPEPYLGRNGLVGLVATGTDGAVYVRNELPSRNGFSEWQGIGGAGMVSRPAVSLNADGRPQVYVRDANNSIWTSWVQPSGSWSSWSYFVGSSLGDPASVTQRDGRQELYFRMTDNSIGSRWQHELNGAWTGVGTFGGNVPSSPRAYATNSDVWLFATGWDRKMYFRRLVPGAWLGWQVLGDGNLSWSTTPVAANAGLVSRAVFVARLSDNSLAVFDATRYPNWVWLKGLLTNEPGAVASLSGNLTVFGRGTDGFLYYKRESAPGIFDDYRLVQP